MIYALFIIFLCFAERNIGRSQFFPGKRRYFLRIDIYCKLKSCKQPDCLHDFEIQYPMASPNRSSRPVRIRLKNWNFQLHLTHLP